MREEMPALTENDEAELLSAAQTGDRRAFDELVRASYKRVYSLAYRLTGNDDDAGDVVQEVFVRAYRSLRRFRGDSRFSTWLFRITTNCASTMMKRRARHRHDELTDETEAIDHRPDTDPVLWAEAAVARSEVSEAVAKLAPKLRAVVVLRDQFEFSHKEIAESLDISESAAKVRLHRARLQLRAALGFSSAADSTDDADGDVAGDTGLAEVAALGDATPPTDVDVAS